MNFSCNCGSHRLLFVAAVLGACCLLTSGLAEESAYEESKAEFALLQVDKTFGVKSTKKAPPSLHEGLLAVVLANGGHSDGLHDGSVLQPAEAKPKARPQAGASLPAKGRIDAAWLRKALGFGLLVGGVFGMMGAGGSMILKPVLYYGFEVQPFREAIFHGYVILVVLAAAAALKGHARGLVSWRMVVILLSAMGFGSMLGSYQASLVPNSVQVWAFAIVLFAVSAHMMLKSMGGGGSPSGGAASKDGQDEHNFSLTPKTALMGVCAGLLSGFMGVGGGFILVPVISELGLDMEKAVPTSQAVVSLSAFLGFWYYMLFTGCTVGTLNGPVTAALTCTGLLGIAVSGSVASRLSNALRQRTFAVMLFAISVGMMAAQRVA